MLGAYRVRHKSGLISPNANLLNRYALDIDLPDCVVNNRVMMALNQYTNDLVTWSNVCDSFDALLSFECMYSP